MTLRLIMPWLARNWVAGAGFMAAALLVLSPLALAPLTCSVALLYLHSPVYMLHQVEEHAGDRFRTFVNAVMFGGRVAMTPNDVVAVNVGVVWSLNASALYVGALAGPGYALVAPYAMLVNAGGHLIMAGRFGRYNPGLLTAAVAFLPLSIATIASTASSGSATPVQHMLGLGGAVVLHALIALNAVRRIRNSREPQIATVRARSADR